jgi:hypothetical protein
MAGQITGMSTLSGTTGLFGTVATTNNTNVGLPSVGIAGGTGDKLIFWAGTGNSYRIHWVLIITHYDVLFHLVQVINFIIME